MAKQATKYPVREILITDIDRSRNYRISDPSDNQAVEALATSIQTAGLLQPVRVYERGPEQKDSKRKEPYILGFGDRRCRAILALKQTTVFAEIHPPASDTEIEQARAIENLHRADLSPLEEVQAVANLLEAIKRDVSFTGDPYDETATRLARSVTWVRDRDYLHRLTKPVREFTMRAGLPVGHLRELAKIGDPEDQMRIACDAAGATVWAFHSSNNGDNNGTARDVREEFFNRIADGGAERWPLFRLKKEVEQLKRSLKVVPWEYAEPVAHGKVKLRACKDCPHNSETDRTLFGLESDSQNPRGCCLNASCFEAKQKAADAAKAAVYQKVSKRQDQSPATIRRAAPRWLKDSTVVGFVQRQLKKAADGDKKPKPETRKADTGRELTPHEKALVAFAKTEETWQIESFKAILEAVNANPAYRVGWCLLAGTAVFQNQENWQFPRVTVHSKEPTTESPTLPKLNRKVKQVIELAMKGTKAAWIELASWTVQDHPDDWDDIGWMHPETLSILAEAVGANLGKSPEWKTSAPTNAKPASAKS